MKPAFKICPMCQLELAAAKFARLDKEAPCKSCQREHSRYGSDDGITGVSAFVYVRRRPFHTPRPPKGSE